MDSIVQIVRILWIGNQIPDPAQLNQALPSEEIKVELEPVEDILQALGQREKGRWDATVVEQASLPDPALKWLQHLCDADHCGEVIILFDPRTPLKQIASWLNGVRSLRFLLKPFDPAELLQLLNQLTAWRLAPDPQKLQAEVSPWLHMELARLTKQATIDQLTGLLRREEMINRANEELQRAGRTGQPLTCIMADIDHFKRVNDVFGHQTGDRTLQRVANLLSEGSRPYDLVGRMGGEEFMMVMSGPSIEEGQRIADRLRLSIQNYTWQEDALPNITMSFGVAEFRAGQYGTLESLSKAADMALYKAKRHGRNQVCTTEEQEAQDQHAATTDNRHHLLLVDDASVYLNELSSLLSKRYQVDATTDPREALAWAETRAYELVITDENMPAMKGHELLVKMKDLQPNCVRIIMTSHGELSSAIQAINDAEVYRYLLKPWNDEELLLVVHQALEYRSMVNHLRRSDRETIKMMADTIELKDRSTHGHYHRVAEISLQIGAELNYPPERLQALEYAAWLHDIGKIGIPDALLKKQGPLNAQEEKIVREHPQLGANLVASVEHIAPVAPFVRHHHERYDGHGFPDGLVGVNIPEESRIVSIANAYDGLLTPRRGRPALTPELALEQIQLGKGTLFDPRLVDIFVQVVQGKAAPVVPVGADS